MSLNALIDAAVQSALWLDMRERLGAQTPSEYANAMIRVPEERAAALKKAQKMIEARQQQAKKQTEQRTAVLATARKRAAEVKKQSAEKRAASETSEKDEAMGNWLRQQRASGSKKKSTK